jgi:uncharacterized glyoxalase superfamily protein PhnB
LRFIQLTPPGSACSICFVSTFDEMAPGSLRGTLIAVDDVAAVRQDLIDRGVTTVTELDEQPWGTFVYFTDPDGNTWGFQQKPEWTA